MTTIQTDWTVTDGKNQTIAQNKATEADTRLDCAEHEIYNTDAVPPGLQAAIRKEIQSAIAETLSPVTGLIAQMLQEGHSTGGLACNPPSLNLDNGISGNNEALSDEGTAMSRKRFKITLPTGETAWITGKTDSEAFANGIRQYAYLYLPQQTMIPVECPTIQEYGCKWLTTYYLPRQKTAHGKKNAEAIFKNHILPFFGGYKLNEVKHDIVQAFYNSKMDLSASTADKIRIQLNMMFKSAIEDEYIDKNVMDSDRYILPTKKTERQPLTEEEFQQMVDALPQMKESDRLFVALCLYAGLRRGEVCALRWTDIDLKRGIIDVNGAIHIDGNQSVRGKTKSKAGIRQLPITTQLRAILEAASSKEGYIVGGGDKPYSDTQIKNMYNRIGKVCPVLRSKKAHCLRHTFATFAASSKMDIKSLQTIMGHSDIGTTMNVYTHPMQERIIAAGASISDAFDGKS